MVKYYSIYNFLSIIKSKQYNIVNGSGCVYTYIISQRSFEFDDFHINIWKLPIVCYLICSLRIQLLPILRIIP